MSIEINRPILKKLFSRHLKSRDHSISVSQLQLLFRNLKVLPVTPIQDLIGLGSLRSILTRTLNTNSITKASIKFPQFQKTLQLIIQSLFTNLKDLPSKELAFFRMINPHSQTQYGISFQFTQKTQRKTRSTRQSSHISSDLQSCCSESSELDLNIKQALQTLKTPSRARSRSSSSNRLQNKTGFCSPLSPKINDVKSDLTEKLKKLNRQKSDQSSRILQENAELQTFIQLEKKVNEVSKVTVSLLGGQNQNSYSVQGKKKIGNKQSASLNKGSARMGSKRSVRCPQMKPQANQMIGRKSVKKVGEKGTVLQKHRKYIVKTRRKTFSSAMTMKLIFFAWKSVVCKRKI